MTKVLATLIALGTLGVAFHGLSAREAPPNRGELESVIARSTGAPASIVEHDCRRHASRLYGDATYVCRVRMGATEVRTVTVTAFDGIWTSARQ